MTNPEVYVGHSMVPALIPEWLDEEHRYAATKFDSFNNPQRTVLKGGLQRGGPAWAEQAGYFDRFRLFYEQSKGDEQILLQASQALGKFVNDGRTLNTFVVIGQGAKEMSWDMADEIVMHQVRRLCISLDDSRYRFPDVNLAVVFENDFENLMENLAFQIEAGSSYRFSTASDLLKRQMELFVAFSEFTGLIAQPGVSSSDGARKWIK